MTVSAPPLIEINWSRCATEPRQHQKEGVLALLRHPLFLLADEVGAGKSKQVVDAAQILFEANLIDDVVIEAPAAARGVWANPHPALGEIAKHGWPSVKNVVREWSVANDRPLALPGPGALRWIVTNYEFIRRLNRLEPLVHTLAGRRVWLVCDEAWAVKDHTTDQWQATAALRSWRAIKPKHLKRDPLWRVVQKLQFQCSRVTLLNGTPIDESPLDLYAQMRLLDPRILGLYENQPNEAAKKSGRFFSYFRARYAMLKPKTDVPIVIGYQNLEELREKVKPYALRRTTRECWDLPPILEPVLIEAKLSERSWSLYRSMRDDMVAWLDQAEQKASVAGQAIVKHLRLAQITSGYLGGVQLHDMLSAELGLEEDAAATAEEIWNQTIGQKTGLMMPALEEIGREKLDAMLAWLKQVSPQPDRILVWARFRAEIERTAAALAGERDVHKIYGNQPKDEREAAVRALNPFLPVDGPVAVVGHAQAGGASLNLAGASLAIYLSCDVRLRLRVQSMGRIDRPGQKNPIRYADVVATGPKGQRTIDHHVLADLREKKDVADWTTATWRRKLLEE